MTIKGISTNVQALLNNTGLFNTVIDHPPSQANNFNGYPAASHYYEGTDSDYATVSQNRRVIRYKVEVYLLTGNAANDSTLFTEAYELVDDVVQMLDESYDLSSQSIPLAKACDIMRPTIGEFERITSVDGNGLMCTINLYCETDISFR